MLVSQAKADNLNPRKQKTAVKVVELELLTMADSVARLVTATLSTQDRTVFWVLEVATTAVAFLAIQAEEEAAVGCMEEAAAGPAHATKLNQSVGVAAAGAALAWCRSEGPLR
jgi:hypothetical protein